MVRDKLRIPENFEKFVASQALDKKYLQYHYGVARKSLAAKDILFHPKRLLKHASNANVWRIVQREDQFVILVPQVSHGGFDMGYNVTKDTNPADYLEPDTGRIVAKIENEAVRLCMVPFRLNIYCPRLS